MFSRVFMVRVFFFNITLVIGHILFITLYMIKAQPARVAISKIFWDVSWNIIYIVPHLLNLNWSEIPLGREGVRWRAGRIRSWLLGFILWAEFMFPILLVKLEDSSTPLGLGGGPQSHNAVSL